MFGEPIVKVVGNSAGHNYTIGDYYFISRVQAQSGMHRLDPIIPKVNIQGILIQGSGNNIHTQDFVRVDPFADNEELITFLKEKEASLLDSAVAIVEKAIAFKEEVSKIADFASKEDYLASRIKDCQTALKDTGLNEDEQSKKILALLATLA